MSISKSFLKRFLTRLLAVIFATSLVFAGFPEIWRSPPFPPKIQKAQAAITYQAPGTIAYSASGGISVAPAYPASIVANDLLVLIIGMKPSSANSGSVTTPGGWTAITSLTGAGGYGTTLGADTGNTNVFSYSKVAAGTESGSLTVTIATNNVSWGKIFRLSNGTGLWSVAGTTGSDTSAGNVSIAMSANPGVTAGDYILGGMVIPTDVSTPTQFSAEALSQTGITFGTVTEVEEPDSTTGNDIGGFLIQAPVSSGTASAAPTMTATAGGTTTNVRGPGVFIRVRELPKTTISNFVSAEPSNSTIAPAGSAQVDSFGLQTSSGPDTVTGATVTLASGTGARVATVALTNDGDTVTYCSVAPSGDTATLTSCGIPVSTTNTQFKVKITAISHASMPAPPGASYAVTGTVTAFTSTNAQSGTDSGSATVTIDNASPSGATSTSGSAGNAKVTLNWITSANSDFSRSVILRWAASSAGSEVPAEGTDYSAGNAISTATVACVRTADAPSTALSGIVDGSGGTAGCTTSALTNGQAYSYKVFQKDSNGNYDAGVTFTGSPFTPTVGALTVDIVDGSGTSVSSPSVTFGVSTFSFSAATTTGTFGVSAEKIRVTNTTATASWTLTTAATSTTAVWYGGTAGTYDYNDPSYSQDGPDIDTVGGRLLLDPTGATITPQSGCNTTGLSLGSATAFNEGVTNSITLISAGGTAQTNCYWDLTGIAMTQSLPASQAIGTYNFQLVLTVN